MSPDLQFPLTAPARGGWCEVCPGVLWIRLPLPLRIDHVNVWAIRDGAGWTVIDTGLGLPDTIEVWEQALEALNEDRAFLTEGGVFTDDMIDAYIQLKYEDVERLRMATHPIEFDMYYSC